jgi:hypothetical protein
MKYINHYNRVVNIHEEFVVRTSECIGSAVW